jgi:hypothetical protein
MEQAEIVNGLKTKMWVERYRSAGEFKFTVSASSGMRDILPIGSFISHVDTSELMIVENHEISDQRGKESELIISGRGLETDFEQRALGSNKVLPFSGVISDYALASDETWNQVVTMLKDHLYTSQLIDDDNAWPYLTITTDIPAGGTEVARTIKRTDLYKAMVDLLAVDEVGVKVVRPSGSEVNTTLLIHKGVDRSAELVFSYDTGEIESADYLWTNKAAKNAAFVSGKWVQVWVDGVETGYSRRVMQVDATDIDNAYSAAPAGADLTAVIAAMTQRGMDAIAAKNDISLTKAEVSREVNQNKYRVDFDVGDLVTIQGDYNEVSTMRISEYVEIEDQNGYIGYPTLTMV